MTLSGASGTNVDVVSRHTTGGARSKTAQQNSTNNTGPRRRTKPPVSCGNCGTYHKKYKCPAYGKSCHKCGRRNNFQKPCRSSSSVHEINNDTNSNAHVYSGCQSANESEYFIDTVSAFSSVSLSPDRAFVQLQIGPQKSLIDFRLTQAVQ